MLPATSVYDVNGLDERAIVVLLVFRYVTHLYFRLTFQQFIKMLAHACGVDFEY
jgi:hypothetical protein